jgi:hypothetical protein
VWNRKIGGLTAEFWQKETRLGIRHRVTHLGSDFLKADQFTSKTDFTLLATE